MMCLKRTSSSIGLLRKATAPERSAFDLASVSDCAEIKIMGNPGSIAASICCSWSPVMPFILRSVIRQSNRPWACAARNETGPSNTWHLNSNTSSNSERASRILASSSTTAIMGTRAKIETFAQRTVVTRFQYLPSPGFIKAIRKSRPGNHHVCPQVSTARLERAA